MKRLCLALARWIWVPVVWVLSSEITLRSGIRAPEGDLAAGRCILAEFKIVSEAASPDAGNK